MKIYVAATFSDFSRARAAMAQLRAAGAVITYDWTVNVDAYPNDDAPDDHAASEAFSDLRGVRDADAVLVLTQADHARGCGMWIEMGAALAYGTPVYIVGPQRTRSIFCTLAAGYETDADALRDLCSMAKRYPEEAA